MIEELNQYDYIISIDLGSTFSGSCYTCVKDKNTIVHVTKWPHQETFEKTPSVCLYDITQQPPVMIKWGQAAVDHATLYPNDHNTMLMSEFKLKLLNLDFTTEAINADAVVSYRTAAIDYLRAIHTYTLQQFLQHNPTANEAQIRYVLTIPATWVNKDSENLRQIAIEANIISATQPEAIQKARLAILSEAHAASLFCEREYCATPATQLFKGQRYAVVDLGGATADLATYECTENKQGHCQLALESMGVCGSTILDQLMGTYLRDQMFFGCADECLINLLVEQFKTKIKHYFGEDGNEHSNHVPAMAEQTVELLDTTTELMTVEETKVPTDMMDLEQDDYDYDAFNDSYQSDDFMDDVTDEEDDDQHQAADQQGANSDFQGIHGMDDSIEEMEQEYIYLSMPPNFKSLVEPLIIENLLLRRDLTASHQIRISHAELAKHVFDPVVSKVISLIRKQIRKSCTTIDTLFLLGGFGQSPYLQKKLHEEFITSTNAVQRIIVPENGYRASMRGGIHYGLDSVKAIPEYYLQDKAGNLFRDTVTHSKYDTLVAIDFNFDEMTAKYSIIKLNYNGRLSQTELDLLIEEKLEWHKSSLESTDVALFNDDDAIIYKFKFDPGKFIDEYYKFLEDVFSFNRATLLSSNNTALATRQQLHDRIYFDFFVNGFMEQLFDHIQTRRVINLSSTRYCASVSTTATTNNTPRKTLKQYLLSRMVQSTRLPDQLKSSLHDAVCDILDDYATKSLSLLVPLKKKIRQVGIIFGILKEDDNEARFSLNVHPKKSLYMRRNALGNIKNHQSSIVFVFDLSFAGQRGQVQVCNIGRGSGLILYKEEEAFIMNLDFLSVLNQQSETPLTSAFEINELIVARSFSVDHLLSFLGTETDFMLSSHVRDYIKQRVDLSRPDEVHTVGDIFMETNTGNVVSMAYQQASASKRKVIGHAIRQFKQKTFTTRHITELLLLPWIRRILVPVLIKAHSNAFKRSEAHMQHATAVRESVSCFVFPEQIIETKYQGQHQMYPSSNSQSCAEYLLDTLKKEIELLRLNGSLPSDIELHDKSRDDKIYGHLDCIIDSVRMPKQQETTRVARKTYAVHFLKYFVQKSNQAVATARDQEDTQEQRKEVGKEADDKQKTPIVEMNIDVQDHLTLYPLIRKDANLITECHALDNSRYRIQDKCSVATVLYVSDEMPLLGEYYISNTSFKKLHRFVIPIQDPTNPIQIQCTPEDYSILFTVTQGNDYKADFRCNDLMYSC